MISWATCSRTIASFTIVSSKILVSCVLWLLVIKLCCTFFCVWNNNFATAVKFRQYVNYLSLRSGSDDFLACCFWQDRNWFSIPVSCPSHNFEVFEEKFTNFSIFTTQELAFSSSKMHQGVWNLCHLIWGNQVGCSWVNGQTWEEERHLNELLTFGNGLDFKMES